MKKLILLAAIAGLFTQSHAQQMKCKHVPAAAKAAFHKDHPDVKDIDWSKDGVNFEAGYEDSKIEMSATYSPEGKLIETEMGIPAASLPKAVMEYIKMHYKEDEVKEASKITSASGVVTYEAELKGLDLIFDADGKFLKSTKS